MRTIVTFKSTKFNVSQTKDYFINPECFGDDAAVWLAEQLEQAGAQIHRVDPFPGPEDFGWYFYFDLGDKNLCLIIGSRPDDDNNREWVVWLENNCGFVKSILGGRKKNIPEEALQKVHKILKDADEITHIKWHKQKEFDAGKEDAASDHP